MRIYSASKAGKTRGPERINSDVTNAHCHAFTGTGHNFVLPGSSFFKDRHVLPA